MKPEQLYYTLKHARDFVKGFVQDCDDNERWNFTRLLSLQCIFSCKSADVYVCNFMLAI